MQDYIIAGIIILVLGLAINYIIKAKKSGAKCIGCSHSKECGTKCTCSSQNHHDETHCEHKYDDVINFNKENK